MKKMSGGQAAVAALQAEKVEHVFGLIGSATNAATTHLYGPGVRRHIRNALKTGASMEEVLETIQLTTVMGIHSCNLAIPILMEEVSKFKE
jgi:alkylhydroperoxidase/carboxymuconolactone decarboxylase family protein YurZ